MFADADIKTRRASIGSVNVSSIADNLAMRPYDLLVEESVYDEVVALAQQTGEAVLLGDDPMQDGDFLGPLVSAVQQQKVGHYIQSGIDEGAKAAMWWAWHARTYQAWLLYPPDYFCRCYRRRWRFTKKKFLVLC